MYRVDDDQVAIIGPYAELYAAVLQVKREVNYDNLAVALKDGWRIPGNQPGVFQQDLRLVHNGEVSVSTATRNHTGLLHMHACLTAKSSFACNGIYRVTIANCTIYCP